MRSLHSVSDPAGPERREDLMGGEFDCNDIPDAAMTLAVVASMANGPTHIGGVGSWRVKETERMAAIVAELTKLGCRVSPDTHSLIPFFPLNVRSIVRQQSLPVMQRRPDELVQLETSGHGKHNVALTGLLTVRYCVRG